MWPPSPPSHDRIARMADDIRQLTHPFTVLVRYRAGRSRRTYWRAIKHDALLDQLRAATVPGARDKIGRRTTPTSRTPERSDASHVLAEVYVGISGWHARLELPSPPLYRYGCDHPSCHLILLERGHCGPSCARASIAPVDWHKAVLRSLVGVAPELAPSIADELADAVHTWWRRAAVQAGWKPRELEEAR